MPVSLAQRKTPFRTYARQFGAAETVLERSLETGDEEDFAYWQSSGVLARAMGKMASGVFRSLMRAVLHGLAPPERLVSWVADNIDKVDYLPSAIRFASQDGIPETAIPRALAVLHGLQDLLESHDLSLTRCAVSDYSSYGTLSLLESSIRGADRIKTHAPTMQAWGDWVSRLIAKETHTPTLGKAAAWLYRARKGAGGYAGPPAPFDAVNAAKAVQHRRWFEALRAKHAPADVRGQFPALWDHWAREHEKTPATPSDVDWALSFPPSPGLDLHTVKALARVQLQSPADAARWAQRLQSYFWMTSSTTSFRDNTRSQEGVFTHWAERPEVGQTWIAGLTQAWQEKTLAPPPAGWVQDFLTTEFNALRQRVDSKEFKELAQETQDQEKAELAARLDAAFGLVQAAVHAGLALTPSLDAAVVGLLQQQGFSFLDQALWDRAQAQGLPEWLAERLPWIDREFARQDPTRPSALASYSEKLRSVHWALADPAAQASLTPEHQALASRLAWETWFMPRTLFWFWSQPASEPHREGWQRALRTLPVPEKAPLNAWVENAPHALLKVALSIAPTNERPDWQVFFKRFTTGFGQLCDTGLPRDPDKELASLLELLPAVLDRAGGADALAQCAPEAHPWSALATIRVVPVELIEHVKHWPVPPTLDLVALGEASEHGQWLAVEARRRGLETSLPSTSTRPRARM